MTDDYDWRIDSVRSWELAIREKRRQLVLKGLVEPRNEEERAWLDEAKT